MEASSKTHISGFHKYWNPLEPTLEPILEMTRVSRKTLNFGNMERARTHWNPFWNPFVFKEASSEMLIFTSRPYSYYNTNKSRGGQPSGLGGALASQVYFQL